MALEYVIDFPCQPKRVLAGNDAPEEGVRRLLGLCKLQNMADAVRAQAAMSGKDPQGVRIELLVARPGEETTPTVLNLAEIESQTEALRTFTPVCAVCPVSSNGRLAGCVGSLAYPISITAEEWLLDRIAAPDTVGGFLLLSAIRDFHYDGALIHRYRENKLFESPKALSKPLPANPFGAIEISTDVLFHAWLGVGPVLSPWHMAMLLVWLSALTLDGSSIDSLDAFDTLVNLPVESRRSRVGLVLGESSADAGILALQRWLAAMISAWSSDVPVHLDV